MTNYFTPIDRRLTLERFAEDSKWEQQGIRTESTERIGLLDEQPIQIIGRRYTNIGGHALKLICYGPLLKPEGEPNICIGMLGYHHPDAEPYCKLTRLAFSEMDLYSIIASINADSG